MPADNPETSQINGSLGYVSEDPARRALLNELPGELAARVGALGMRHPPEDIRRLVEELCGLRPWSAEELAMLTRRNPETVR